MSNQLERGANADKRRAGHRDDCWKVNIDYLLLNARILSWLVTSYEK